MKIKKLAPAIIFCVLMCAVIQARPAERSSRNGSPSACFVIRGRAIERRGDGFFSIWHVGTHHIFMPANAQSADLICEYFDCDSPDRQPALFADFTVCPTTPYEQGAAQPVIVWRVEHPIVFTDWPLPRTPREYVQNFYSWYAKSVSRDRGNVSWMDMLKLTHWDLSSKLAKLLKQDAIAQSHCGELIGIDFDPFLLTQYPAEKYEVGAVEQKGDHYLAKVYRIENGHRAKTPDVIAEVAQKKDGRWYFVDMYCPELKDGLLAILDSPLPKCTAPKH